MGKKDSFATKIVRDEKVTVTSFVANVGGLLGLCMGFSLVSVVEMIYFCVKEKLFGVIDAIFGTKISKQRKDRATKENAQIVTSGNNNITTSNFVEQ